MCPKSPLFCFSNWRQFWSPALAPSLSCCHTTVVLLPGSLFQLILFFFCHTRERLLLSLSESYRCMACRCALAPFPPFLSSHVFKIFSFVFFVPIRFVFAPCSPTRPFLFLMHRKCVSSGVYQVCALRTVPDSMSQVGSGRCPEFCAVGIMSVVSVRALVEAYMYGLRIRLYRRGSLEEIV